MNIPVVTALCLYHCYCYGAATFGSPSYPSQSDFRQHALDIGNRLCDLLKQEISFLSKISSTPIPDLDRITIPSIMSTWPTTTVTNQPPSTNQITINAYAGPASQPGTSGSSGQCQSRPNQCATMQSQPSSNPPNGYAGVEQGLQGVGTSNQQEIRPPGGDGVSMGGSFTSPNPPPPGIPLPLPYQGGTTEVIQTDQGPVTVQIPPSSLQPVDDLPQQAQPQVDNPYEQAPSVKPLPPLSPSFENNPSFYIGDYQNKPSPTDTQPQSGQTNPPTNSQSPYSGLPLIQQTGQNINPPVTVIPMTQQPQPINNPSAAASPPLQQPQQNINLPGAANTITQTPQPIINPSAAASPTVQQPLQASNPLVGTSPLTTGQTLNPVYVNPGNPTPGYPQVQNNAPTPTNQQTPIVSGTQGWPQSQQVYQPTAPIPVTQTPQTSPVLPAQTQTTGTVALPQPGVPSFQAFQAFPATTISAAVPAVNA